MCKIGGVFRKIVALITLSVLQTLTLAIGCQFSSLVVTGHYVDVLTLSNLYSYRDVGWKIILISSLIIIICLTLTFFTAATAWRGWYRAIRWPIALYCLFFCFINPQGAVLNFGKTYHAYMEQSLFTPSAKMRKLQQQLYAQNDTFSNDFDVQKVMDFRNKNVVVVFAEGFSTQFIDKFNNYKSLTPNIDKFLEESVYFNNYYNHTAATFRGLRGQLTSSYQFRSGYRKDNNGLGQINGEQIKKTLTGNLISVPHILKNYGYHPYFLTAHPDKHQLNMVLETLEFDTVYGADDFVPGNNGNDLTDKQLFSALSNMLSHDKLQKPFFIGTYNMGTHFGQNSPDLKYGDGHNILLNTIHNFDDVFGKFWNSVKDRQDLVIILTADHATPPYGGPYNETFGTHRLYPVGKIPFVIWTYDIKHQVIDVKGRNSLAFAPTLLQAMGIKHSFNYFLGCSLFNSACSKPFGNIYNEGDDRFLETPAIRPLDEANKEDKVIIQKIRDFYNLSEDRRFL